MLTISRCQLAISLAQRFNGEIINGDVLQMYEGLPIATNKLPIAQRHSIPHHLLGCIKLGEEPWIVSKFVQHANRVILEIASRGKLPILVGGGNYYTQSLLFQATSLAGNHVQHMTAEEQEKKWPKLSASTEEMLEELERIDPVAARQWHPNDRRKIRHSLELWYTTGRTPSEIYQEQKRQLSGSQADRESDSQPQSQPSDNTNVWFDPLILWLHADLEMLSPRLEKRVETMLHDGLEAEVNSMYDFCQKQEAEGNPVDQSCGIWIAIGYKELLPYITAAREGRVDPKTLESLKKESIERMKIATRQYAKRQVRWIRLKLQRALHEYQTAHRTFFLLDGTDLAKWDKEVEAIAAVILSSWIEGKKQLPDPTTLSERARQMMLAVVSESEEMFARHCELCDMTMMGERAWAAHTKSKRHKRALTPRPDWALLYPKNRTEKADA